MLCGFMLNLRKMEFLGRDIKFWKTIYFILNVKIRVKWYILPIDNDNGIVVNINIK